MQMVGEAKSDDDVKDLIEQYLQDIYPHVGFIGKGLKVRISTKRLLELYRVVSVKIETCSRKENR